jgi:ABC-type amino acid transport substrate-binding protein
VSRDNGNLTKQSIEYQEKPLLVYCTMVTEERQWITELKNGKVDLQSTQVGKTDRIKYFSFHFMNLSCLALQKNRKSADKLSGGIQ